ncbi:MAG TPA: hypothetical protein PKA00_08075 [Saprospiraceae bacterium]|nr:hypothetical protein [Saprospiraceae bacterium]HMQ82850.1 hypothetical protein [Saprospiraceae bacterium]
MKLKELLDIAKENLKDLSTLENPDFRLEQAELKKDKNIWEIVVSYLVENTNKRSNPFTALTSEFQFLRMYKKIAINERNEVVGFYIFNDKE